MQLALAARELLAKDGLAAAVVSMPSWELFAAQEDTYRNKVMGGDGTIRVACEAATGFGWERWLGSKGAFVGMKGFGASAKASELYRHFGITAEAVDCNTNSHLIPSVIAPTGAPLVRSLRP